MTRKKSHEPQKRKNSRPAAETAMCPFRKGMKLPINGLINLVLSRPGEKGLKMIKADFGAFRDEAASRGLPRPSFPQSKYFDYYTWAVRAAKTPGVRKLDIIFMNELVGCQICLK
jgi:hypothetical protein